MGGLVEHVLADLLVAEGAQLGGAGAHNVVRGRDKGCFPGKGITVSMWTPQHPGNRA
jgi:hypothetical protein